MEGQLYPLLYRILPPTVYHVYLHPDDYREVEAIGPSIAADAERGLTERVEELNRRWPSFFRKGKQASWQQDMSDDLHDTICSGRIMAMRWNGSAISATGPLTLTEAWPRST